MTTMRARSSAYIPTRISEEEDFPTVVKKVKLNLDLVSLSMNSLRSDIEKMIAGVQATISVPVDIGDVVILRPDSITRNTIQPTDATYPNLILKAIAGQTAKILDFQSSAGTSLASFSALGNLAVSHDSAAAAGSANISVYNSLAGDAGAHGLVQISTNGATGGDPSVRFNIEGVQLWSAGIDNSDSDAFVISEGSALGTTNDFRIAVGGAISIPRGNLDVTRSQASAAVSATIENTSATGASAFLYLKTTGMDGRQGITFSSNAATTWTIERNGPGTDDQLLFYDGSGSTSAILSLDSTLGIGVGLGGNRTPSEILHVGKDTGSSDIAILLANESNTSTADAIIKIMTAATGADGVVQFLEGTYASSSVKWSLGKDGSDSDAFVLSLGSTLGTTTILKVTTAQAISLQPDATKGLGFWGATPVVQPASANQAAVAAQTQDTLTDNTTGTANTTLVDVGIVFSQAAINDNFADVAAQLAKVKADIAAIKAFQDQNRSDQVTIGIIKGAA